MVRAAQPLQAVATALVLTCHHRQLPRLELSAAGTELAAPMEGRLAPLPQLPVTLAVQCITLTPILVAPV